MCVYTHVYMHRDILQFLTPLLPYSRRQPPRALSHSKEAEKAVEGLQV